MLLLLKEDLLFSFSNNLHFKLQNINAAVKSGVYVISGNVQIAGVGCHILRAYFKRERISFIENLAPHTNSSDAP